MADRYSNPFQGIDVFVPAELHGNFQRFCKKGKSDIVDRSPFPRMVDLWFLGVCVAVRLGLRPIDAGDGKRTKIIDGSIFATDPWRIDALMLIAIGTTNDPEIVGEPRQMMSVANGLAAAGVPEVVQMLQDGQADPIWNLSDCLNTVLAEAGYT